MSRSTAKSDSLPDVRGQARPPVALIAGPTASGKSAVALCFAERTGGVIVNADASQVYADLAVLSARPDAADLARAPHRLFGHVDGTEAWSAARWADEARAEIAAIHESGRLPILTGGTGLYLDTLVHGIAPIPDIDPAIRDAVRAMPVTDSHAALAREDPQAAARLNAATPRASPGRSKSCARPAAPSLTGSAGARAALPAASRSMPAWSCAPRSSCPNAPKPASTSCSTAAPSKKSRP